MKNVIKLNFGCGWDYKKGFINIDIDPRVEPDLIIDLTNPILPFNNTCIDKVLLQDVLEHVTKEQAKLLLFELQRILKPDGKIEIRIPYLYPIIENFETDPEVMFEFIYGNTENNGIWGVHKYGYTPRTLKKNLKAAGFIKIKTKEETTNIWAEAIKIEKIPQMNLLIIQQSPDWGGAEEWMFQLSSKLNAFPNIKISAATNYPKLVSLWQNEGISVIQIPNILDIIGNWKGLIRSILRLPGLTWFYTKLLIKFKRQGGNLILMSGFSEKLLVTWIASWFNFGIVWYEYAPLDQVFTKNFGLPKFLYRLTNSIPDKVLTLSKYTAKFLTQSPKISKSKIVQIYPGVDIPNNINKSNTFIVGCLARVAREKGQYELIKEWPKVLEKIPQAQLLIAGDGPDIKNLKIKITELNLETSVKLLGFVENKVDFYRLLDLFVYPGLWELEGFGLVLAEAMSIGLPVIAYNKEPMSEVVGDVGVLVDPSEINGLSKAIISLLIDEDLQKKYSNNAFAKARKDYNVQNQVKLIRNHLQEVVNQHVLEN